MNFKHTRATFLWRISGVSVFVWNFTFVCTAYNNVMWCYVRVTYVWRMKRTRDVSTAYVPPSIFICGVSVLYQLCFNTYENYCLCSLVHAIRTLQLSIIRDRRRHWRNIRNLEGGISKSTYVAHTPLIREFRHVAETP